MKPQCRFQLEKWQGKESEKKYFYFSASILNSFQVSQQQRTLNSSAILFSFVRLFCAFHFITCHFAVSFRFSKSSQTTYDPFDQSNSSNQTLASFQSLNQGASVSRRPWHFNTARSHTPSDAYRLGRVKVSPNGLPGSEERIRTGSRIYLTLMISAAFELCLLSVEIAKFFSFNLTFLFDSR